MGVISQFDEELVLADIPGLIKGAHEGKGLGDQFLAHIERCKILLHILDSTEENIIDNYKTVQNELKKYGKNLSEKKEIIALSKVDVMNHQLDKIINQIEKKIGVKPILFSSFSKNGLKQLINRLFKEFVQKND